MEATELFKKQKMNIALLTSSTKKVDRDKILKDLFEGKIDLIIGTQSLIQEDIKFNNLGLVITDEQHRFGVNQRKTIQNKGITTDILYMSATPIPRTYALALYGDLDVSLIKTKPSGRKTITTKQYSLKEMPTVLELIKKELEVVF